ncbi:MAG: protease pro-enzyme activation domain-containing protein [Solirubrobacterales bacterium]
MKRSRPAILALLTALALGAFAAAPAAPVSGAASADAVRIGSAPELPAGARAVGAAPAAQQLDLYVALEPRDPAALARFAAEVSDPRSPRYGDHLSVPEFAARFGAGEDRVAAVRAALAARGLSVGATGANDLSLPVSATVAEAEAAFGVSIEAVRTAAGELAYANDRAPQLPAAAAPFVQGVLGLDDLPRASHAGDGDGHRAPAPAPQTAVAATTAAATFPASGPRPCQDALDTQQKEGGYTADQIAAAYGFDDLYAAGSYGAGQTVALLEMQPLLQKDVDAYQECYGTDVEVARVDVNGGPGPESSDDGEAALDVEQLIGLAPEARIVVYQAPNSGADETAIFAEWVQRNLARVMSSSWGICERETSAEHRLAVDTLLQEAAAQGQSFFVAAGDYGSTDCYVEPEKGNEEEEKEQAENHFLNVDFPGSDPWATDVGGTRLEDPTAPTATDYLWNDSEDGSWGAGGSGVSERFPMPSYQQAAAPGLGVIGPLSSGAKCGSPTLCRQVPDVSALAATVNGETGYVVHAEDRWETNGGTSAAAPLWAAVATLVNASPACGGQAIGFANPALYAIAGDPASYAASFRDVTTARPGGKPTTNIFEATQPYPAGPGYDMASGLGTPRLPGLAAALCALANPPAPPAPPASEQKSSPSSVPAPQAPPAVPTVGRAALTGVAASRPKLVFTVTARPGARLRRVVVQLPPALLSDDPSNAIRFRFHQPRGSAKLKLAYPRIQTSRKLLARVKSGVTKRLGFVVVSRETGGKGARLPLVLPLDP